jgi:endonuclease YncB( thermonuclease family)
MGLLTITNATLDIDKLWPAGKSDADTLTLDVTSAKFEFQPHERTSSTITRIFESAMVRGQHASNHCISPKHQVIVRLQSVDAPELHCRPSPPSILDTPQMTPEQKAAFLKFNFEFRQARGEDSTARLRTALQIYGKRIIQVRFESRIDLPNDLFDCYGRAIGDVFVTEAGPEFWINRWLLEDGLAFPSFYDSLEPMEITELISAWERGKRKADGLWMSGYQAKVPTFNPKMVYSRWAPGPVQDRALTYPKVFRRQTEWWARTQALIGPMKFVEYLQSRKDEARRTQDFVQLGRAAEVQKFADFVSEDETLVFEPESLIFGEEPTQLVDCAMPPCAITSWSLWKQHNWSAALSGKAWVNSVAISDDGRRIAGVTFLHNYEAPSTMFGSYAMSVFDAQGRLLWARQYPQTLDGLFAVAISGDGQVVAGGGQLTETGGVLCICDAGTGGVMLEERSLAACVDVVALSHDGSTVAVAAEKLYLYQRRGEGYVSLNPPDGPVRVDDAVKAVAIHPSGKWLVAGDKSGKVTLVTLNADGIENVHCWTAPEKPIDRTRPDTSCGPIPFLRATIAENSEAFAVGGGDFVYGFTKPGFIQGAAGTEYDTWDTDAPNGQLDSEGGNLADLVPAENVRSVALSADGGILAVVANRRIAGAATGALLVYKNGNQSPAWHLRLPRNPNDVSLNRDGSRIAIADGFPPGDPAAFLVFDGDGHELWQYPTTDMNWPIAINREGTVLAAGSDDGKLYYFEL